MCNYNKKNISVRWYINNHLEIFARVFKRDYSVLLYCILLQYIIKVYYYCVFIIIK